MTPKDRKFLANLPIPRHYKRTLIALGALIRSGHTKVIASTDLETKTLYCRKQVHRHIQWLEAAGLIRVERGRVHEISKRRLANRITCYTPSYFPSENSFHRWLRSRLEKLRAMGHEVPWSHGTSRAHGPWDLASPHSKSSQVGSGGAQFDAVAKPNRAGGTAPNNVVPFATGMSPDSLGAWLSDREDNTPTLQDYETWAEVAQAEANRAQAEAEHRQLLAELERQRLARQKDPLSRERVCSPGDAASASLTLDQDLGEVANG